MKINLTPKTLSGKFCKRALWISILLIFTAVLLPIVIILIDKIYNTEWISILILPLIAFFAITIPITLYLSFSNLFCIKKEEKLLEYKKDLLLINDTSKTNEISSSQQLVVSQLIDEAEKGSMSWGYIIMKDYFSSKK
jgi:hypothetical protein